MSNQYLKNLSNEELLEEMVRRSMEVAHDMIQDNFVGDPRMYIAHCGGVPTREQVVQDGVNQILNMWPDMLMADSEEYDQFTDEADQKLTPFHQLLLTAARKVMSEDRALQEFKYSLASGR